MTGVLIIMTKAQKEDGPVMRQKQGKCHVMRAKIAVMYLLAKAWRGLTASQKPEVARNRFLPQSLQK